MRLITWNLAGSGIEALPLSSWKICHKGQKAEDVEDL